MHMTYSYPKKNLSSNATLSPLTLTNNIFTQSNKPLSIWPFIQYQLFISYSTSHFVCRVTYRYRYFHFNTQRVPGSISIYLASNSRFAVTACHADYHQRRSSSFHTTRSMLSIDRRCRRCIFPCWIDPFSPIHFIASLPRFRALFLIVS